MSEPRPPSEPAAAGHPDHTEDTDDSDGIDDAILAAISDYLDGAVSGAERAEVERKIAGDPSWKRAHTELTETRKILSGLRKAPAPPAFVDDVAETIHLRSAGRLFGRRSLGDRVPLGALLAVALAVILGIGYVLWSSSTGSLKVDRERAPVTGSAGPAVAPP